MKIGKQISILTTAFFALCLWSVPQELFAGNGFNGRAIRGSLASGRGMRSVLQVQRGSGIMRGATGGLSRSYFGGSGRSFTNTDVVTRSANGVVVSRDAQSHPMSQEQIRAENNRANAILSNLR